MLDEAERSLHDALCVLQQTVQDSRVIYGGGYPEMQMAKVPCTPQPEAHSMSHRSTCFCLRKVSLCNGHALLQTCSMYQQNPTSSECNVSYMPCFCSAHKCSLNQQGRAHIKCSVCTADVAVGVVLMMNTVADTAQILDPRDHNHLIGCCITCCRYREHGSD